MCATHYNRATGNADTPEKRAARKFSRPCEHCGGVFVGDPRSRFCSKSCSSTATAQDRPAPSRRDIAARKLAQAAKGNAYRRTWVSGACTGCAKTFVGRRARGIGRYCSEECKDRAAWKVCRDNDPERFSANQAQSQRRYKTNHPGRVRAIKDRYKSRRRAQGAGVGHHPYSRADIFAAYGGTCAYCDAPAEHIDHVVAISRGGADAAHNLLPACAPCNLGKGAKSLAEWAATF
jgi:5-methylcytosine-specific restriction endonuclease McrA